MPLRLCGLAVLAAWLAVAGAASATPPTHTVHRIFFVGDSLAHGVSAHMQIMLAPQGREWRNATVEPHVFTGGGVIRRPGQDLLAVLRGRLQLPDPPVDIVILMAGINDVGMPIGGGAFYGDAWQEAYLDRMQTMIAVATDRDLPVFWVGMPVLGHRLFAEPFETHIRPLQYALLTRHDSGATLVDLFKLTTIDGAYTEFLDFGSGTPERFRANDGIHFSPNGYRLLAGRILDRMEADLSVRLRPGPDWSVLEE